MSKNINFTVVLITLIAFLFLGLYLGKGITAPLGPDAYSACAVSMNEVIDSGKGDVYNFTGVTEFDEPQFYYLASYSVDGNEITDPVLKTIPKDFQDEQQDLALQQEAWHIFTSLIPEQNREMVAQFNVFTDGFSNTLAAVDQSEKDLSQWMLEVDVADLKDKDALTYTLVHEYAHLLTLNSSQVTPDTDTYKDPLNPVLQKEKAADCSTYFVGTGCTHPDSYMNAFYQRFWFDVNEEWQQVDALQYGADDLVPYYNALYAFYLKHQDRFVDDYAVTHPAEDIAESFTYFVFNPKPVGNSIRDQKLAFFYEYPELVQLREDILSGACSMK